MELREALENFRQLTKEHFGTDTIVIFANQSRTPKKNIPLVTIAHGVAKRPLCHTRSMFIVDEISSYQTGVSVTVDLFTNGSPVYDDDDPTEVIGNFNTVVEDMTAYQDFLDSTHVKEWCTLKDMAFTYDGTIQDLTGIVNDTTYEFRARLVLTLYFTHKTDGPKAIPVSDDDSGYNYEGSLE